MVFTIFIVTDTIQVRTIIVTDTIQVRTIIVTDTIQVRTILTWLFPSKLEVNFFIARQVDRRANIGTELYTTER